MKKSFLCCIAIALIPSTTLSRKKESIVKVEPNLVQNLSVPPQKNNFDLGRFTVDVDRRKKQIVELVKNAIEYLRNHRNEEAFHAFLTDKRFTLGDVTIYCFDTDYVMYVQGTEVTNTWKDFRNFKNTQGINPTELQIKKAAQGGGWVNYEYENGYKSSYCEQLTKNGKTYIVGAGWYPITKDLETESFVKSAVAYFYKFGKDAAFSEFNNKLGKFIKGDLYIYAYTLDGYYVAHGDNSALIGRNLWDMKDVNGVYITQENVNKGKAGGGWVHYIWKNAPKISYVQPVQDKAGKKYIIGSGYYPDSTQANVVELVKKAVKEFNAFGLERARESLSKKTGDFVFGDLFVFMYDFKGKVLANGREHDLLGQNLYDYRNEFGQYIVRDVIDIAKKQGSGWLSYHQSNSLYVSYVEKVSDKEGDYVIGSGFYPASPAELIEDMVRLATEYLRTHSRAASMREFASRDGKFRKGSYHLFVFNMQGDCLLYGDNYELIWSNFKNYKNIEGKDVFKLMVQKVQQGGGWITYKSHGAEKYAYVQKIDKDGESLIIGSAFYK